jgi:uncharacterized protein YjbJ (UPF0337 family)
MRLEIEGACALLLSGPVITSTASADRRHAMNWDRVEGNWKQYQGKVVEHWGKLTHDDLDRMKGKREQLEGKLQEAYGISRDQAKKDVDEFCKSL